MDNQDKMASVKAHWESPDTVSLADQNLRELEASAIAEALPDGGRVLDMGCGDGVNTCRYAERAASLVGIDYSAQMIARAQDRFAGWPGAPVLLRQMDLSELDSLPADFDAVISQRCLINLPDFDQQARVIAAVQRRLAPGGVFLLLECLDQGRANLNRIREKAGLGPIAMPWHNTFFDRDRLEDFLAGLFTISAVRDFSLYYLVTRVMNPLLGLDHSDPWSKRLDEAGRRLQAMLGLEELKGYGPQVLYVLTKANQAD